MTLSMPAAATSDVLSIDRFVPHVSTVEANRGQTVGLFLRERLLSSGGGDAATRAVVLLLHGGFAPSVVAYDLRYRDYSLMEQLARAGFDVFTFSHTGYAPSPRPRMDDPVNVDAAFQQHLVPHMLSGAHAPRYPFKLVSSRTEWDEIETIVDFIRELRGVARVHLLGWSTGAPRAGGYAALHPDKVGRVLLYGPSQFFDREDPPATMPEPGSPTLLQTREFLLDRRWRDHVHDDGQIEDPAVCEAFWRELMAMDEIGACWGREGLGIMRAPSRMNFGWKASLARIAAPTLYLLGEHDNYARRLESWKVLSAPQRMFVRVAGCSHFMQFERARHLLYRAAAEWFSAGSFMGYASGEFAADTAGRLCAATA
jgi:pimeloyl-ACP methyl ester carboxylesterase